MGMLKEIAIMVEEGMSKEQIAEVLKVNVEWVEKVVGADGFSSVQHEVRRED